MRATIAIAPGTLAVALLVLALAGGVSAHAVPVKSIPAQNSCILYSPGEVRIWFSERVDPVASKLRVENVDDETPADKGDVRVERDYEMAVTLIDPLPPGNYTVFYSTLSLDDGHVKPGSYDFLKIAEDDPDAAQKVLCVRPVEPPQADPTMLDIGLRAAHFITLYLGVGGIGFLLFVWDPLLRAGRPLPVKVVREGYGRVMGTALLMLPLAAVATLGVYLLTSARSIEGVPGVSLTEAMGDLTRSTLGQAYLARMALLGALSALLLWAASPALKSKSDPPMVRSFIERLFCWPVPAAPGRFRDRRILVVAFALGAAAMSTQSFSGHPSAFGMVSLPVAADIAHQIAVTLWVGGLLHLLVSVYPAIRAAGANQRGPLVYLSVSRFSQMATIAVPIIVLTGGLTAILLGLDSIEEIFGSVYGLILTAKVALVMPVVAVGAYQKFRLIPELESALPLARSPSPPNLRLGRFRRATQAEDALGIAVLIVTAVLSSTASLPGQTAEPSSLSLWAVVPGSPCVNVTLIITPPPTGPGSYNFDLFTSDCGGVPLWIANATLVFISPNASVPPADVNLIPVPGLLDHPNHYLTEAGHRMREPGTWGILASALNYTYPWSAGPSFKVKISEV